MLRINTIKLRLKNHRTNWLFALAISSVLPAYAMAAAAPVTSTCQNDHPWSVTGSLGYTNYVNMYKNDGQTAVGRFAIGKNVFNSRYVMTGLELGVQNGNDMRLGASATSLDALGGLPIQTTVKPMVDLLATFQSPAIGRTPIFAQLKGGIAYRTWEFNDRTSINDVSNIAGEVQAGFGLPISQHASLSLLYQGVYGASPHLSVDATEGTGHVSNIPVQNGVLLSFSYLV